MKKVVKLILCSLLIFLVIGCKKEEKEIKNKIFSFEDKYYIEGKFIDLDKETLNNMIENKESFGVFVYQPLCAASSSFNEVLNEFINQYQMSFYKVKYSDIKETNLGKTLKYYPSFIIYKDGELVEYLEADKDEDLEYYKSVDGFKNWITKYVKINEKSNSNNISNTEINRDVSIDIDIDEISYNKNKVNIYLFWGSGCPHCEHAIEYIESLEGEYGKYFTLNKFEVWNNDRNKQIYTLFANKMGDSVKGVPYIIIGEKSFYGFSENSKDEILDAITSQYKNSYDIYFDNRK